MINIKRKICPKGLPTTPGKRLKSISYITIHTTGNRSASADAAAHALLQYNGNGSRQSSWHYTVDADSIWQSYEDYQECWHAGDGTNGPGNSTSIGIEICVNSKVGFQQSCDNAARLTAELLRAYKLSIDKVVQHAKWMIKDCPKELRSGEWGVTWNGFIGMVKKYMTGVKDDVETLIVYQGDGDLGAAALLQYYRPGAAIMSLASYNADKPTAKTLIKIGGDDLAGAVKLSGAGRKETMQAVLNYLK